MSKVEYIINPKTGRLILKDGKAGRLLAENLKISPPRTRSRSKTKAQSRSKTRSTKRRSQSRSKTKSKTKSRVRSKTRSNSYSPTLPFFSDTPVKMPESIMISEFKDVVKGEIADELKNTIINSNKNLKNEIKREFEPQIRKHNEGLVQAYKLNKSNAESITKIHNKLEREIKGIESTVIKIPLIIDEIKPLIIDEIDREIDNVKSMTIKEIFSAKTEIEREIKPLIKREIDLQKDRLRKELAEPSSKAVLKNKQLFPKNISDVLYEIEDDEYLDENFGLIINFVQAILIAVKKTKDVTDCTDVVSNLDSISKIINRKQKLFFAMFFSDEELETLQKIIDLCSEEGKLDQLDTFVLGLNKSQNNKFFGDLIRYRNKVGNDVTIISNNQFSNFTPQEQIKYLTNLLYVIPDEKCNEFFNLWNSSKINNIELRDFEINKLLRLISVTKCDDFIGNKYKDLFWKIGKYSGIWPGKIVKYLGFLGQIGRGLRSVDEIEKVMSELADMFNNNYPVLSSLLYAYKIPSKIITKYTVLDPAISLQNKPAEEVYEILTRAYKIPIGFASDVIFIENNRINEDVGIFDATTKVLQKLTY
ncbi:hypothetical protein OAG24_01055 [bacterium]|nr:hypothetical protein [bacterium]